MVSVGHYYNHHDTRYRYCSCMIIIFIIKLYIISILITGAIAIHNSFLESILPVHIYDLNCSGIENTFQNCPHNALNPNLCNYRQDAAVSCLPVESGWCN